MSYQEVFKRVEKKYLLNEEQYRALRGMLDGLAADDEYGLTQIMNIYYDTPAWHLIRTSLEKPVYKEKLRLRSYGTPGNDTVAFVEIKKKLKGVVYKRRVSMPYKEAQRFLNTGVRRESGWTDSERQILGEIGFMRDHNKGLMPGMVITYDRIAMAGIHDPNLRITFDTNIRWRTEDLDLRKGARGEALLKKGQHLMEIKIAGGMPMELSSALSRLKIFPVSYSKYGNGYLSMQRQLQVIPQRDLQECADGTGLFLLRHATA